MRIRHSRVLTACAFATIVALGAPVAAASTARPDATATWRAMSLPNVGNAGLVSIACPAANSCFSAGSTFKNNSPKNAVMLHWNGTAWSIQALPALGSGVTAGLDAVVCTSGSACMAVGATTKNNVSHGLVERWNGTSWSASSATGTGLYALSCPTATSCFALGGATGVEHWNGSSWSTQKFPNGGDVYEYALSAITCTSATWCEAVGSYTPIPDEGWFPLAAHWNGSVWTVDRSPQAPAADKAGEFAAIVCTSTANCLAVGDTFDFSTNVNGRLAERWNGHTWTIVITPAPNGTTSAGFAGVSCLSASSCVVVGDAQVGGGSFKELVDRWNGTTWGIDTTPGRGPLQAVACNAPNTCTSVGSDPAHIERTP